eukprot:3095655-Prymnesium_polylepis.1
MVACGRYAAECPTARAAAHRVRRRPCPQSPPARPRACSPYTSRAAPACSGATAARARTPPALASARRRRRPSSRSRVVTAGRAARQAWARRSPPPSRHASAGPCGRWPSPPRRCPRRPARPPPLVRENDEPSSLLL